MGLSQLGRYHIRFSESKFLQLLKDPKELRPMRGLLLDEQDRLWALEEGGKKLWRVQLDSSYQEVLEAQLIDSTIFPQFPPLSTSHYQFGLGQTREGQLLLQLARHQLVSVDPDALDYQLLAPLPALPSGETVDAFCYYETDRGEVWRGFHRGYLSVHAVDTAYFSKRFQARFGVKPSQYLG